MNTAQFVLHSDASVFVSETASAPVRKGLEIFSRDFETVFGSSLRQASWNEANIRVAYSAEIGVELGPEAFRVIFDEEDSRPRLTVIGQDDLGVIYGLLHLSRSVLGVDPLWYWTDKTPIRRDAISVPAVDFDSKSNRVRFRGWFVNDEVCLIGWTEQYPPPRPVWEIVFETLLRLGGNIVIPGTDLPRDGIHRQVASEMGLYLTHHHAEPLGAEMFFRAYPNSDASFDKNPELFMGLWQEAIDSQKGKQIVWTLGFRGQGDCPFWEQDPSFDTPESRGELISRAIRVQYEMLQASVPGAPCVTYLYGEVAELYREGHIAVPDGVCKIWSDNGYGRMASRRQGNQNLRVPSLPNAGDRGPHGIYYHATFHDLQASSHLTMLPVSQTLLVSELEAAFAAGADDLLLVNCGNVRPHVFALDLFATLWRDGLVDAGNAPRRFCERFFAGTAQQAADCLTGFYNASIAYGPHEDDRAGDEFYHHPARSIVGHLMRGNTDRSAADLLWATGDLAFKDQVAWFEHVASAAAARFQELEEQCLSTLESLEGAEAVFFRDYLLFQTRFHKTSAAGLAYLCQSVLAFLEGQYPQAFVLASQSIWSYRGTTEAMKETEHGKWKHFFRADWLTNVDITIYSVSSLRSFYRMFGDNPDFFLWHKEYLMPESEKKIYLENTHRAPPADDELAERLKVRFAM